MILHGGTTPKHNTNGFRTRKKYSGRKEKDQKSKFGNGFKVKVWIGVVEVLRKRSKNVPDFRESVASSDIQKGSCNH